MTDTRTSVATEDLRIVYSGPGLDAGTMDVRDLAPSLLALSALFQQVHREAAPGVPDPALQITALESGSFAVNLRLYVDSAAVIFASDGVAALANLKTLIIDPAVGLLAYLKRRSREPEAPAESLANGDVQITWADGTQLQYPATMIRSAQSLSVRRDVETVMRPLDSEDCDTVAIASKTTEEITVTADDLETLRAELDRAGLPMSLPAPNSNDAEVELTLTVVASAFDGKTWRFNDGGSNFRARITDDGFWREIDAGEQFAKGDRLRCRVQLRQYETAAGVLRTERTVVKVLGHQRRQPGLGI